MPNRLAQAQSLYLRKHADNPIDWWTWCDEALETARRDNKPIFLSIGYSSCHWCTVMEGEAFSDPAIAEYMNAHYLPIKVDREERPDLDSIYMQSLQMIAGQGGWPLNVFLSPDDLVPFYGGTYFPIEPRYGRPGFLQVLRELRRIYDTDGDRIATVKTQILGRLQQAAFLPSGTLIDDLLQMGFQYSAGVLAHRGMGPSFPMMPYANAALRGTRFNFNDAKVNAREACIQRGMDLVLGGIFDHVAGGFHRYTVDPTWTVPHFEKMLYDNGQIMEYLADLYAWGMTSPAVERAIALTVAWLQREMTASDGYFYAAQDADSFITPEDAEPEEGAFYVWDYDELRSLLSPDQLHTLETLFTVSPAGNFEGKNVLQRRTDEDMGGGKGIDECLTRLFEVRYGKDGVAIAPPVRTNHEAKTRSHPGRIPPVTDTKMIVAWNSLMISGLARAAGVFQTLSYLDLAIRAAEFIWMNQWVGDRFHRLNYEGQAAVIAQSEDYVLFIKALLDLDQAALALGMSDRPWLSRALKLQSELDTFLWSVELGGYYNTDARADLLVRERSAEDNATPSANGIAIANLVRLYLHTEDLDYLDRAEEALQSLSQLMGQAPQSCPSLFSALDWFHNCTLVRTCADQIPSLAQRYLPTVVLKLESNLPEGVVGLVCQGLSCKAPAQSVEQFNHQLQSCINRRT